MIPQRTEDSERTEGNVLAGEDAAIARDDAVAGKGSDSDARGAE